jgi:hypothetical protein
MIARRVRVARATMINKNKGEGIHLEGSPALGGTKSNKPINQKYLITTIVKIQVRGYTSRAARRWAVLTPIRLLIRSTL